MAAEAWRDAAVEGALCLARLTGPDGRFVYRYDALTGLPGHGYNTLRHCGAAWAMLDVARRAGPLPAVVAAAGRALGWLSTRALCQPPDDPAAVCVASGDSVKLGGSGLAMLALCEYAALGDRSRLPLAAALARYVLTQRRLDGDFHHKRSLATGALVDFRSDYYTGEALFGLARLAAVSGEARWRTAAAWSARMLAPTDYGRAVHSHWMLYALAAIHAGEPEPVLRAYAGRIAAAIVAEPGYRAEGRSTPVSCRSEGLMAYLRLAGGSPVAGGPDPAAVLRTVEENLALQQGCAVPGGAIMRGGGSTEVRIDYIQHHISACLAYWAHRNGMAA